LKIWGDPPKVKINTPKQNAWRERRHESRAAQKHKIDDNAPFDGLLVNRFCRRFRTPDCLNAAWAYNRRICSASAPSHAHCNSYLKLIFPAWKLKILQVYDISTATPLRGLKAKFFSIFPPGGPSRSIRGDGRVEVLQFAFIILDTRLGGGSEPISKPTQDPCDGLPALEFELNTRWPQSQATEPQDQSFRDASLGVRDAQSKASTG
jgi:hypothetical protein